MIGDRAEALADYVEELRKCSTRSDGTFPDPDDERECEMIQSAIDAVRRDLGI